MNPEIDKAKVLEGKYENQRIWKGVYGICMIASLLCFLISLSNLFNEDSGGAFSVIFLIIIFLLFFERRRANKNIIKTKEELDSAYAKNMREAKEAP
ncbi:hypothetical protein C0583_02460 [Candidatus Parcubacteria bacterium]|nr:MAG: hypothetical protein C0583_02460 [Candidatus Parcubacteria bacterium]